MAAIPSSTHSPKFHPPPFPESNEFSLSSSSQPSRFHFFLWESDAGVTTTTTMKTSSFRFSRSRLGASPSPPPPPPFALYGIPSMTTVGFPYRENKDSLSLSLPLCAAEAASPPKGCEICGGSHYPRNGRGGEISGGREIKP